MDTREQDKAEWAIAEAAIEEIRARNSELVLLNVRLREIIRETERGLLSMGYTGVADTLRKALMQVSPGGTQCKRGHTAGANDPQECAWPRCDCDPVATSVLAALQEEGIIVEDGTMKKALDDVIAVVQSYVAAKQSSP